MKLLEKILRKFGYRIMKQHTFDYLVTKTKTLNAILNWEHVDYHLCHYVDGTVGVEMTCGIEDYKEIIIIKEFSTDDEDYNELCAQELLDELTKEI